jgi:GT2 family glycosyltransferase
MDPGRDQAGRPTPVPVVRVVVINFDGGQMTLDCLDSVLASDWPAAGLDVILVDNGSLDDIAEVVRHDPTYAAVTVLEPLANLGFAGGCNLGIAHPGEYDYVALVNNDAHVESGWLRSMISVFDDPGHGVVRARPFEAETPPRLVGRIGAVSPKMLLAERFVIVDLDVPDAAPILSGDPRHLGVRLTAVRLDARRVDERVMCDEGFFDPEPPERASGEEMARWSKARGSVRIAVDETDPNPPTAVALRLISLAPRTVTLSTPRATHTVEVGLDPVWIEIDIDSTPLDVINNVGSELYLDGFAGDRGFLEVDRGQYDQRAEVFAWCGGAVLMSREYLDDVGLFDERLFLYYEDTDLAWRGRLRNWRYVYTPDAVVRHRHGASAGSQSDVFRFHTERNRLLVVAKNAPFTPAAKAGLGELRRLVATAVRQYLIRPLTLRLPVRIEVARRWRVTRSYVGLLPAMVRSRRSARPLVARSAPMSWQVDKWAGQ